MFGPQVGSGALVYFVLKRSRCYEMTTRPPTPECGFVAAWLPQFIRLIAEPCFSAKPAQMVSELASNPFERV